MSVSEYTKLLLSEVEKEDQDRHLYIMLVRERAKGFATGYFSSGKISSTGFALSKRMIDHLCDTALDKLKNRPNE